MDKYIAFLIASGRNWIDLNEVVEGYQTHSNYQAFLALMSEAV